MQSTEQDVVGRLNTDQKSALDGRTCSAPTFRSCTAILTLARRSTVGKVGTTTQGSWPTPVSVQYHRLMVVTLTRMTPFLSVARKHNVRLGMTVRQSTLPCRATTIVTEQGRLHNVVERLRQGVVRHLAVNNLTRRALVGPFAHTACPDTLACKGGVNAGTGRSFSQVNKRFKCISILTRSNGILPCGRAHLGCVIVCGATHLPTLSLVQF